MNTMKLDRIESLLKLADVIAEGQEHVGAEASQAERDQIADLRLLVSARIRKVLVQDILPEFVADDVPRCKHPGCYRPAWTDAAHLGYVGRDSVRRPACNGHTYFSSSWGIPGMTEYPEGRERSRFGYGVLEAFAEAAAREAARTIDRMAADAAAASLATVAGPMEEIQKVAADMARDQLSRDSIVPRIFPTNAIYGKTPLPSPADFEAMGVPPMLPKDVEEFVIGVDLGAKKDETSFFVLKSPPNGEAGVITLEQAVGAPALFRDQPVPAFEPTLREVQATRIAEVTKPDPHLEIRKLQAAKAALLLEEMNRPSAGSKMSAWEEAQAMKGAKR